MQAPSSVLEISANGKLYVLVASAHAERLSIFERVPSRGPQDQTVPYEFLVYRGTSGRCDAVRPIQHLGSAEYSRRAHKVESGWSALAEGWPDMNFRWNATSNVTACVFAAGAARGGVAAFCFMTSSSTASLAAPVLACVDAMYDGQDAGDGRIVDGLAGKLAFLQKYVLY